MRIINENNIKNRLYFFYLGLLIILFIITTFFISFSNRIEGDAAFHALVSKEISEKGKIINSTSYILANEKNNFPIAYPEIFHLIGSLNYLYAGKSAFLFLPVLYGALSLYFLAMILYLIHKNLIAVSMGVTILALNLYFLDYSSKYFMETGLVFSVLASFRYAMKYISQKNVSNLYISSIFFGLSVTIKQQGLVALPIFAIILFFSYLWTRSIKQIIISISIFILIAAPPMIQLFFSTGSILYAGDNPPKIIQIIEQPIRNVFGVKLLESDKQWNMINQGRRDEEITTWRSISNNTAAWITQDNLSSIPWAELTGILLLILLFRIISLRSTKDFIMLIFLVLFYFLLYYLARPRYALPLIVLPSVVIFYIINTLTTLKVQPRIILFFVILLTMYISINFSSNFLDTVNRDDFGFYGVYNKERGIQLQSLYDSIKTDKNKTFTILSPLPYETAYYAMRPTIWANPYGATDLFNSLLDPDENKSIKMLKKYRIKYLIIYNDRLMKFTNWAGINPTDGLFSKIAYSKNFQLIKSNESGKVYMSKFEHI